MMAEQWRRLAFAALGTGIMGLGLALNAGLFSMIALEYRADLPLYGFQATRLWYHLPGLLSGAVMVGAFGGGALVFARSWRRSER